MSEPTDITTTDEIVGGIRKISVTFERKTSDSNYGHTVTRGWSEGTIPTDATHETVYQSIVDLGNAVKSAVLTSAGIEFLFDAENGIVVEVQAPVTVVQHTAPQASSNNSNGGGEPAAGGHGITVANLAEAAGNGPLPDWLVASCQRDGVTRVYDNRASATGKQPLFKEAVARGAGGHGKGGEQAAYWPPNR